MTGDLRASEGGPSRHGLFAMAASTRLDGDNAPKMMSIGMHCRLLGRPGRITALQRFLDHIAQHDKVWVARRIDIARHWAQHHPAPDL